ncbi:MAG: hypothetical protein KBG28_09925 [Kofleriaceae bacterium]|nr:hypothetical protein [Kofleriaceae bacterium]
MTYHYASGIDKEAVSKLTVGGAGGADYARYTYYQDGGMKRRTYPGAGPGGADVAWDFLYDSDDQLKRVVKKHVTGAVETTVAIEDYLYHHDGARAVIVKRDAAGVSQEVRRFIGDQEAVLSPAGAVLETLAHVTMGTVLARVKDRVSYEHQFHGLGGSTLAAVATDGTVNTAFTYGPYGEVIEASGGQVASHRRRMNDKFQDDISGLGYYGVRYYDQVLLGWTQGDPLYRYRPEAGWDEPRRGQLYGFVMQNPLRYVDPDGTDSVTAIVTYRSNVSQRSSLKPYADMTMQAIRGLKKSPVSRLFQKISPAGATLRVGKIRQGGKVASGPIDLNFSIVDLSDKASVARAKKIVGFRQVIDAMATGPNQLDRASTLRGDQYTVVAVDRIALELQHLDLKDPKQREKALKYILDLVSHEPGHSYGAGHCVGSCLADDARPFQDIMGPVPDDPYEVREYKDSISSIEAYLSHRLTSQVKK